MRQAGGGPARAGGSDLRRAEGHHRPRVRPERARADDAGRRRRGVPVYTLPAPSPAAAGGPAAAPITPGAPARPRRPSARRRRPRASCTRRPTPTTRAATTTSPSRNIPSTCGTTRTPTSAITRSTGSANANTPSRSIRKRSRPGTSSFASTRRATSCPTRASRREWPSRSWGAGARPCSSTATSSTASPTRRPAARPARDSTPARSVCRPRSDTLLMEQTEILGVRPTLVAADSW